MILFAHFCCSEALKEKCCYEKFLSWFCSCVSSQTQPRQKAPLIVVQISHFQLAALVPEPMTKCQILHDYLWPKLISCKRNKPALENCFRSRFLNILIFACALKSCVEKLNKVVCSLILEYFYILTQFCWSRADTQRFSLPVIQLFVMT